MAPSSADPPVARGQHAQKDAHDQRKDNGGQRKQQGRRQARHEQLGDGHVLAERVAEVETGQGADVVRELLPARHVEAVERAHLFHVLGRGAAGFACHHVDGIAGRQLQQAEGQQDDDECSGDDLRQPPRDVAQSVTHG
mgnify:CR=1 FL=1